MSLATIRNHVHNILEKLEVRSKIEAVSLAFRRDWIACLERSSGLGVTVPAPGSKTVCPLDQPSGPAPSPLAGALVSAPHQGPQGALVAP